MTCSNLVSRPGLKLEQIECTKWRKVRVKKKEFRKTGEEKKDSIASIYTSFVRSNLLQKCFSVSQETVQSSEMNDAKKPPEPVRLDTKVPTLEQQM